MDSSAAVIEQNKSAQRAKRVEGVVNFKGSPFMLN